MTLVHRIKKHLLEPLLGFLNRFVGVVRTKTDDARWAAKAQKGEFEFHKTNTWRNTADFMASTKLLFESFGFNTDDFKDKTVLDLGAGSKLRSKFFEGSRIVVIEPMADDCIREIAWCDLQDAAKVYSLPAEQLIEELVNEVDFVMSINVLDHCYDFEIIIDNTFAYMKQGALAFLSFDVHFVPDKMHPLVLTEKICTQIFERKGFRIERFTTGFGKEYRERVNTDTYGHGKYCLNYWLRKP